MSSPFSEIQGTQIISSSSSSIKMKKSSCIISHITRWTLIIHFPNDIYNVTHIWPYIKMVLSTFFLGKLYMHPMGHESIASPSIQLIWEEEMLVEHSSLAKCFPFDYIIFWIIKINCLLTCVDGIQKALIAWPELLI